MEKRITMIVAERAHGRYTCQGLKPVTISYYRGGREQDIVLTKVSSWWKGGSRVRRGQNIAFVYGVTKPVPQDRSGITVEGGGSYSLLYNKRFASVNCASRFDNIIHLVDLNYN